VLFSAQIAGPTFPWGDMSPPERKPSPGDSFIVPASIRPRAVQMIGGVEIAVRNFSPMAVEIAVRRPWFDEIEDAVEEASDENPELQQLSPNARTDLATSLATALPPTKVVGISEGTLEEAVDAALRGKAEREGLSRHARTAIVVRLLNRLPKDERDVAIPIISMQSAELVGQRLVGATWGLVAATTALVIATIVLIVVTATHN
jgi:hypothetical protein